MVTFEESVSAIGILSNKPLSEKARDEELEEIASKSLLNAVKQGNANALRFYLHRASKQTEMDYWNRLGCTLRSWL